MNRTTVFLTTCLLMLASLLPARAQKNTSAGVVVPRLVNYSGKALDAQGRPLTGVTGVTFSIYKDQYDGAPLWLETQNMQPDSKGNYTIQLGATKPEGLPQELFTSGEARWLGVRVSGNEEQQRVLLLSVPYALKAADAQTLGGLPASAFMLAGTGSVASIGESAAMPAPETVAPAVSGTGATDFLPLWTNTTGALGNSVLFQSGTGSAAKIGLNTMTPAATLDVKGSVTIRSLLNLPATTNATASAGADSNQIGFVASAYNSSSKAATNQVFRWLAEPTGNNTTSPAATLNLLFGVPPIAPAETGLKINSKGVITFASGQSFPGTGSGTVKSVGLTAPSSDFTVSGSPVTGSGALGLNWNVAPTSADTANAIVKRDSTGSFTAASIIGNLGVAGYSSAVGVYGQTSGTENGDNGVEGVTFAQAGSGVAGFNDSGVAGSVGVYGQGDTAIYGFGGATGVFGHGTSFGFATDGNVQQARTAGGWVKAMAYVNAVQTPYNIPLCYNSTLAGAAASTPPCGFTLTEENVGVFDIDFGFKVTDRFLIGSLAQSTSNISTIYIQPGGLSNNSATAVCAGGNATANCQYYVVVF